MTPALASLIIGARRPLRIESALPRDEVVRRLKARIVPWGHAGLRGTASEQGVSLFVVKSAFLRNSWRSVLDGRWETTPQGTALVGTVGFDRLVQFVLLLAVCIGVIWSARELFMFTRGGDAGLTLLHALKGLWAVPVVMAMNYIGSLAGADEGERLDAELRSILQ